ncbi:MAG TPA: hypothetical protein VGI32_13805 [Steroidobacteraceae bacterium]|jgi:hypothetical protein
MNLKTKSVSTAALPAGALLLLASGAFAAPPQGRLQSHMQSQIQAPAQHLDLRAPSHAVEAGNIAEKPGAFPSTAHHQNLGDEQVAVPNLGSVGMRAHPAIEDFVRRVHREGLPVARLFETKSALVHIGLSPRGKPGLWLVQKTH